MIWFVLAALVLLARPGYALVRFLLLPAAAKRNYPAALLARWRWRHLARGLDLARLDAYRKPYGPGAGLAAAILPWRTRVTVRPSGEDLPRLVWPRAKFRADPYGLVATVKTI